MIPRSIVLVLVFRLVEPLAAQTGGKLPDPFAPPPVPPVGRYQVVRSTEQELILIDTATGKLYRASAADFQPLSELIGKPKKVDRTADPPEEPASVLQLKGYAVPARQIQVSPRVAGQVVKLFIKEGQKVRKGDVLAQLDTTEYQAAYDKAEAVLQAVHIRLKETSRDSVKEMANVQVNLAEVQKEVDKLTAELARLEQLTRVSVEPPAKEAVEQARKRLASAKAALIRLKQDQGRLEKAPRSDQKAQLETEIKQAEANLVQAKWRLDACTIRALIDGTILTKDTEEGNVVNPMGFKLAAVICEMADLSDLEIEVFVQERDIARVSQGQRCLALPEAFQKDAAFQKKHPNGYEGIVARIRPVADRAKGAIPIRIKVQLPRDEEGMYLKPDLGVIVSLRKVEK
jgi:multidrug resistance efflux pump